MEKNVLNEKKFQVFVILAETLPSWKHPNTEEGMAVLKQHYAWGAALKASCQLLLAGPMNMNQKDAIEHETHLSGLIMLLAPSQSEAETIAHQDPFHTSGFRKNKVHHLNVSITDNQLYPILETITQQ